MRRVVVFLVILAVLPAGLFAGPRKFEKLADLRREIILLNLINGLYLTPEQMQGLLDILGELQTLQQRWQEQLERHEAKLKHILAELKLTLLEEKPIPEELAKQVHQANRRFEEIALQHRKRLCELEERVKGLLTENQIYQIEHFKPCLIPPKQGLIGQEGGEAPHIQKLLERVRHMPERRYQVFRERFVEHYLEKIELEIGVLEQEEREAERQRVLSILEKARTLPEEEFKIQQARLAEELKPEKPEQLRPRKYQLGRIGRFLLDERLVPILEARLEKASTGSPQEQGSQ